MRTIIIFIAFLLFSLGSLAQSLQASVSKTNLSKSERINFTLALINADGEPVLPQLSDFDVLQGPSVYRSTSIVNGRKTQEISYTYVIRPKKIGTLTIPPISINTNKGVLKSNAVTIEVGQARAAQGTDIKDANLFTTVTVSNRSLFVGEPLIVTYKIYTKFRDISARELRIDEPDGFWAEEIEIPQQWTNEVINGISYRAYTLKQSVLFPQTAGTMEVGAVYILADCRNGMFQRSHTLEAESAPQRVTVKALPAGRSGNYGTYSGLEISAKLNKKEFKANEAFNLEIKVSGKGNMKLVSEPDLQWPSDFEVFDPKIKDAIRISSNGESGSRTFEYVVIPRSSGNFELPPWNVSYFDYREEKFKDLSTPKFTFEVERGTGGEGQTYTYNSKTDVNILSQDIRFLKSDPTTLKAPSSRFFGTGLFYGLLALPWIIVLALAIRMRSQRISSTDKVGTKMRAAMKIARKQLKVASSLVSGNDSKAYFAELYRALTGYVSDKFNISQSELTKEKIAQVLSEKTSPEIQKEFLEILDTCEMARFAPVEKHMTQETLKKAEQIIEKIEKA